MRRTTPSPAPGAAADRAGQSWLSPTPVPTVGLDPHVWTCRVRQAALWRLIENWHAGRRPH